MSYSKWQPWVVCFAAALFFFFEFVQLNMFNTIGPALTKQFNINAPELANISNKYFLANIIFLFPTGMLLDHISTRRAIIIAMLVAILCTYGFALSTEIWQLKLARFFTGVASTFCFLSCVRLASRWFPPRKMAFVVGLIVTFAMLGGVVAQTPLALLNNAVGWRTTVIIDASVGVLLWIVVILFVQDRPPNLSEEQDILHASLSGKEFWQSLGQTIKTKQNWLAGLYTSLMNLPVFVLGAIWGVFYLTQVRHLSSNRASVVTSMLFFGLIFGSPAIGWFSDFLLRRKSPMIWGAVFSLIIVLILMFAPNISMFWLAVLFFGLGFMTSAQIISYPLIAESNPLPLTATAEGLASVLIMGGGFVQTVVALLMQINWDQHYVQGVPLYSQGNYLMGFSVMPIAFLLSIVLAAFVRETQCRSYEHQKFNHEAV